MNKELIDKIELSIYQICIMKNAIGYDVDKVKKGVYKAYQNRYCSNGFNPDWDILEQKGLAWSNKYDDCIYYYVSTDGLKVLEFILSCEILQCE